MPSLHVSDTTVLAHIAEFLEDVEQLPLRAVLVCFRLEPAWQLAYHAMASRALCEYLGTLEGQSFDLPGLVPDAELSDWNVLPREFSGSFAQWCQRAVDFWEPLHIASAEIPLGSSWLRAVARSNRWGYGPDLVAFLRNCSSYSARVWPLHDRAEPACAVIAFENHGVLGSLLFEELHLDPLPFGF